MVQGVHKPLKYSGFAEQCVACDNGCEAMIMLFQDYHLKKYTIKNVLIIRFACCVTREVVAIHD